MLESRERCSFGLKSPHVTGARACCTQHCHRDRSRRFDLLGSENRSDAAATKHACEPTTTKDFAHVRFADIGIVRIVTRIVV